MLCKLPMCSWVTTGVCSSASAVVMCRLASLVYLLQVTDGVHAQQCGDPRLAGATAKVAREEQRTVETDLWSLDRSVEQGCISQQGEEMWSLNPDRGRERVKSLPVDQQ